MLSEYAPISPSVMIDLRDSLCLKTCQVYCLPLSGRVPATAIRVDLPGWLSLACWCDGWIRLTAESTMTESPTATTCCSCWLSCPAIEDASSSTGILRTLSSQPSACHDLFGIAACDPDWQPVHACAACLQDLKRFLKWGAEHLGYPELAVVEAAAPTAELEPMQEGQAQQVSC